MRNNAAGMAHEQEIHNKKGVVLIYQLADLQERHEQNTSSECTLLPKKHVDGVLTNRNFHVLEFQSFIQAEEDTLLHLHMDNETVQGHIKA